MMVAWYWLLWPFALLALAVLGAWLWAIANETQDDRDAMWHPDIEVRRAAFNRVHRRTSE